jgi:hypothetical protein
MKTKPFLLATAGSTVDGRTIDDKMLQEMAAGYNPATYGARLNIEHIRGISGEKPFRAYGDVLSLSTAEVDVDFNGKTEKRLGLFGVFDVSEDAKALNDAGQKVYPSIEIEPNFAGKGFAYLMGCALTDSPASVATERLKFNRALPGVITVTAESASALEPAESVTQTDAAVGVVATFFSKLGEKLGLAAEPQQPVVVPQPKADAAPAFDPVQFTKDLGETLGQAFGGMTAAFNTSLDKVSADVAALKQQIETTADPKHLGRPLSTGLNGKFAKTDC